MTAQISHSFTYIYSVSLSLEYQVFFWKRGKGKRKHKWEQKWSIAEKSRKLSNNSSVGISVLYNWWNIRKGLECFLDFQTYSSLLEKKRWTIYNWIACYRLPSCLVICLNIFIFFCCCLLVFNLWVATVLQNINLNGLVWFLFDGTSFGRLKVFRVRNLLPVMIWSLHCLIGLIPSQMVPLLHLNNLEGGELQVLGQKLNLIQVIVSICGSLDWSFLYCFLVYDLILTSGGQCFQHYLIFIPFHWQYLIVT